MLEPRKSEHLVLASAQCPARTFCWSVPRRRGTSHRQSGLTHLRLSREAPIANPSNSNYPPKLPLPNSINIWLWVFGFNTAFGENIQTGALELRSSGIVYKVRHTISIFSSYSSFKCIRTIIYIYLYISGFCLHGCLYPMCMPGA